MAGNSEHMLGLANDSTTLNLYTVPLSQLAKALSRTGGLVQSVCKYFFFLFQNFPISLLDF